MGHKNKNLDRLWPGIEEGGIWSPTPKVNKTLKVVSVYLPFILQLFDIAAGLHVGSTYLVLLCRSRSGLVMSQGEDLLAWESGFSSPRAIESWFKRMEALKEIRAIDTQRGGIGNFDCTIILDPLKVLEDLDGIHDNTPNWSELYELLIMRRRQLEGGYIKGPKLKGGNI